MIYLLMGPDDYSLRGALNELKGGMGDETSLAINTTILTGQPLTLTQLRTVCETLPFLAEKRLVMVHGLLARFEPKSKAERQTKTERAAKPEDAYQLFATYITNQLPESAVLVLIEGEISSGNPLLKMLSGKAQVRSFPLLKGAQLQQWIGRRMKEEGGSISPRAAGLLARLVGGNLWVMANEINKLVLFASGRRIEEEDVQLVTSYAQEASVFAMVDAILEGKAEVAERLLEQLFREGATPTYLLAMLSRQARMIVRIKELKNEGQPPAEIRNRLGLTSEFAWRKVWEQASRYSLGRLKELYPRLLTADLAIKTGKYEGELALDILVAELCQQS